MRPTAIPIEARHQVVAVIGDPIAHSRSPQMHNAAFKALGLPWVYVAFRVDPKRVGEAMAGIRGLGIRGINVTIPHKEAVIPYLDELSEGASAVGAVNTIIHRDGRLRGENTDVIGLHRDLSDLGVPRRVGTSVILGAGGASRAAVVALARRSRRVVIAARRPGRAKALARGLQDHVRAELVAAPLDAVAPGHRDSPLANARLVVNATPMGMDGGAVAPIGFADAPRECLFYDTVYTAQRTPFVAAARRARRPAANGLGMLLHQGAEAFRLWTGKRPPLDVMRRAIRG